MPKQNPRQQFKLVLLKAETEVYCNPEWMVAEDVGVIDSDAIAEKVIATYLKASVDVRHWAEENARIIRDGITKYNEDNEIR